MKVPFLTRRRRRPHVQPPALKSTIFEVHMTGRDGRVFAVSSWDDNEDPPGGYPVDRVRLQREVVGLAVEPGDHGVLYSYPDPESRDQIRLVGKVIPTGGDFRLAVKKALRNLRDNDGAWWVTESVIDRLCDYLYSSDVSMSYLDARITDALDDDDTYRGEGKDWHIAPMVRAIHAGLAEIDKTLAVESDNDVITVERTWPPREWPRLGVPSCEDCENGVQHLHWSSEPDPSLRDSV